MTKSTRSLSSRVRLATVVAVAGAMVLAGCSGGPFRAKQASPYNIYKTERVLLLDRKLDPLLAPVRIVVLSQALEVNQEGFPQLRLEIANNRSKPTSMELQTVFKDMKDLPVHISPWQPAVVPANSTYQYMVVCPEKSAVDYQVKIKSLED